jgi:translation elongation factor EF-1beta
MPEMPMDEFTAYYATMSSAAKNTAFDIGLGMSIGIEVAVTEENYKAIMLFVKYLDNNADLLVKAGKKVADDAYNILADAAKRDAEDREDMESDREYQRQHGYDGQRDITQASDVNEDELREAIRKAVRKALIKEAEFETRLFQVTLKIQVDRDRGGGIEQKLNRIRAIEGVTVVGHEDVDPLLGKSVIEARIKFHPDIDAMRAGTYISQRLVPEINSSKLVPGVKVIDIVKGSLKRLDK